MRRDSSVRARRFSSLRRGLYSDARTASMGTSLIMAQQPPFHFLGDFSLVEDTGVPDAFDQELVARDLHLEV